MIEEVDKDGSGEIEIEEFMEMMKRRMLEGNNIEQEILRAFTFFDEDDQGYIDFD